MGTCIGWRRFTIAWSQRFGSAVNDHGCAIVGWRRFTIARSRRFGSAVNDHGCAIVGWHIGSTAPRHN